ncbi:MAG: hypothetical protein WDN28_07335 [Chthoniobacter sp.]
MASLALSKNDFALAAKNLRRGGQEISGKIRTFGSVWRGAFAPSDSEAAQNALEQTLKFNPNHPRPRGLLIADQLIDGESYDDAARELAKALTINPHLAEAHAYRAVLAHFAGGCEDRGRGTRRGAEALADESRGAAPHSDHKLSQKIPLRRRRGAGSARTLKWDLRLPPRQGPTGERPAAIWAEARRRKRGSSPTKCRRPTPTMS